MIEEKKVVVLRENNLVCVKALSIKEIKDFERDGCRVLSIKKAKQELKD